MNWKHLFKRAGGGVTIIQPPPQPPTAPTAVGRSYFDYYIYKDGDQIVAEYRDGTTIATSTDFAQVFTAIDRHVAQTYGGYVILPISIMMDRGVYELRSNLDLMQSMAVYYIYGVGALDAYQLAYAIGGGERVALMRLEDIQRQTPSTKLPLLRRARLASEEIGGGRGSTTPIDLGKYATVIRTNGHYIRLYRTIAYNVDILIDGNYTSDTLAPDMHTYPPQYRAPLQGLSLLLYYSVVYANFSVDQLDVNTISIVDGDEIYTYYSQAAATPTIPSNYNLYMFGSGQSIIYLINSGISSNMNSGNLYIFSGFNVYMKDVAIGVYAPYTRLYSACGGQIDIDGGGFFISSFNENLYVPVIEFTCPNVSPSVNIIRPIGWYGNYSMPIVKVMGNEVSVNNTPYRVSGATTITGDGSTTTFSLGQHNIVTTFNGLYLDARCPDSVRVTCSSTLPVRCYLSQDLQTVYAQFDAPPPAGQQVTVVWEVAYVKYCRPQQPG